MYNITDRKICMRGGFIMADVLAIFGVLLILGLAFPGLLATWFLLFDSLVKRASIQIEDAAWQSFFIGILFLFTSLIPFFILIAVPVGFVKAIGWIFLGLVITFASLGASGLVLLISSRSKGKEVIEFTSLGDFLKGAIIVELAFIFPFIGWFVVVPITMIFSLGAITTAFFSKRKKTINEGGKDKKGMEMEPKLL